MAKTFRDFVADALTRVQEAGPEQVLDRLRQPGVVLLDVREREEFQTGHLPGAILIPRGVLEGQAPQMLRDAGAEIIAYCGSGMRSALAADVLQQMGYRSVRSLAGGFRAWTEMGGPVER